MKEERAGVHKFSLTTSTIYSPVERKGRGTDAPPTVSQLTAFCQGKP
jgi:hypothetical protein